MRQYRLTRKGKIVVTLLCTFTALCMILGVSAIQNSNKPCNSNNYLGNNILKESANQKPTVVTPPKASEEKAVVLEPMESIKTSIFFEPDKAEIKQEFYETLDSFSVVALEHDNIKIQIEGNCAVVFPYTEIQKQKNYSFSVVRAKAVADYLQTKGIDPCRFVIIGNGSERTLKDNTILDNPKYNRRVDMFFITDK